MGMAYKLGKTKNPNTSTFIAVGRIQPATSAQPPVRMPLAISFMCSCWPNHLTNDSRSDCGGMAPAWVDAEAFLVAQAMVG